MIEQDLEVIDKKLSYLMMTSPNHSLSGVFKALRKDKRISLIGDYPLLSHIIIHGYNRTPKYQWTRKQVFYAMKQTDILKELELKHAYMPTEWKWFLRDE